MSHTNVTTHYSLPQFVGTDTPAWLTDVNTAMADIDAAVYAREQAIAGNANDISALDGRLDTAEANITSLDTDINAPSTGILARLTTDETAIGNNSNNISTNTSNISSLNTSVSAIQSARPVIVSTTLAAADWSGSTIDIADASVTAKSIINIGLAADPSAGDVAAWQAANIQPGTVTAGTGFSLKAMNGAPTIDLAVVYTREEAV